MRRCPQKASDIPQDGDANCTVTFGQFSEPSLLVPNLTSHDQESVLQELTQRLVSAGRIKNSTAFFEAALAREIQYPTVVGKEVVVPHVRSNDVLKLSVAVGMAADGVRWGSHGTARMVFLFAVPAAEAGKYLLLLSGLSRLISNKPIFAALQEATESEEMLRLLNEAHLPG